MAPDRCDDDVREFIERAAPTHPRVIDTEHLGAELCHVVNVPTMIWIDEQGRICRPHDSQFGTDIFTAFHGKLSEPYLDMLRAGGTLRHRELLAPFGLDATDPAFWDRGLGMVTALIDELETMD